MYFNTFRYRTKRTMYCYYSFTTRRVCVFFFPPWPRTPFAPRRFWFVVFATIAKDARKNGQIAGNSIGVFSIFFFFLFVLLYCQVLLLDTAERGIYNFFFFPLSVNHFSIRYLATTWWWILLSRCMERVLFLLRFL